MITDESVTLLADKLGIATEHIYEVFVEAQPVVGMIYGVCVLVIVLGGAIGYRIGKKMDDEDISPRMMISLLGASIGGLLTIVLFEILRCMLLPEYTALIKLLKILTSGGGIP